MPKSWGTTISDAPSEKRDARIAQLSNAASNKIVTSKYNPWNFLPVNLFGQFVYYPVNIWFAILTALQFPAQITITRGSPTMLIPLTFVLLVPAVKDAVEDYRRHQSDKLENNRVVLRRDKSGKAEETRWKDIKVADVLLIRNCEFIPADVMILGSSSARGGCYVETANLDGETNHKIKHAPLQCVTLFPDVKDGKQLLKDWHQVQGTIEAEAPNDSLYSFAGTLCISGMNTSISFDASNLLLRGCKLQNTDWVVGKVVYTGHETKIQMNQTTVKKKMTHVEWIVLRILIGVILIQIIFCAIGAFLNVMFLQSGVGQKVTYLSLRKPDPTYLKLDEPPPMETFVVRFLTFVLIFGNFVPISLIATMHMVKLGQAIFIHSDDSLVHNNFRATPRTSDLNEELGQVEYVFCDKTGTLTQNRMEFRKCAIDGKSYGRGTTQIAREVALAKGYRSANTSVATSTSAKVSVLSESIEEEEGEATPNVKFRDPALSYDMKHAANRLKIYNFFLHVVINHVVYPMVEDGKITYSASPEEQALVYFAYYFNFQLLERTPTKLVIQVPDRDEKLVVQILAVLEFNSARKRSSTVVRYVHPVTDEDVCLLYTKGADSTIDERLDPVFRLTKAAGQFQEHTTKYAMEGFRTLVFAHRSLSQEEFDQWIYIYDSALNAVEERDIKIELAAEIIEAQLIIDGVTAIEDKLQEEVGETIKLMREAGMKVWMLTGDKLETAINVGIATSLLSPDASSRVVFDWGAFGRAAMTFSPTVSRDESVLRASTFILSGDMHADQPDTTDFGIPVSALVEGKGTRNSGESHTIARERCRLIFESSLAKTRVTPGCYSSVVVDGPSLLYLLERADEFFDLARNSKTVICCRVSPDQKGQVVRLMKCRERAITLAIGDGANDCNMIRSAHVGIGMCGEEGLQAFNVCDYGIAQFRFLQGLLFMHGRYAYRRISVVILYIFYKNIIVVMPQYFLGAWSHFSGMRLYPDLMYQLYNVFFTGVPIWIFGMLDQDIPRHQCTRFPGLYTLGPERYYLNIRKMFQHAITGFWHAALVFSIPFFALAGPGTIFQDGKSADIWLVGTVVMLLEICIVNIRLILDSYSMNWVSWAGYLFCAVTYTAFALVITYAATIFGGGWEGFGVYSHGSRAPIVYPVFVITLTVTFGCQTAARAVTFHLNPTPIQRVHAKINEMPVA